MLITDSLSEDTASQTQLVKEFARDLAAFLKIEVRPVCMTAVWEQTTPKAAKGESLHTYLREVSMQYSRGYETKKAGWCQHVLELELSCHRGFPRSVLREVWPETIRQSICRMAMVNV